MQILGMAQLYPYFLVFLTAFVVNIPLGYKREDTPKFSTAWLFWIHASIPLLIYLRVKLAVTPWTIPLTIAFAVAGQIIGARLCRRRMSRLRKEQLEQIPDLNLPRGPGIPIDDKDVTIVLLNMGGPKTNDDIPEFMKRLFCDRQLIRFPGGRFAQEVFARLLVKFRTNEAKRRYQLIGGGSPILESSLQQVRALSQELERRGRGFDIELCFNYSAPLPDEVICRIREKGHKYILPLSLYPQYSSATTGSNIHYLKEAARRFYPQLRFLECDTYYLRDGYIESLAERIREQTDHGRLLDEYYILFSAHGLPLYFVTEGDPYVYQVNQTMAKVLDRLSRHDRWSLAFQSAVGPLQWLRPYTEDMIRVLAERGVKKLLVVPISFVTDHIETLCEIDIEYRAVAESLGYEDFRMSRAIETHPGFIRALADCVEDSLKTRSEPDEASGESVFERFSVKQT